VRAINVGVYPRAWSLEALYTNGLGLEKGGTLTVRVGKAGRWPVITVRAGNGRALAPKIVSRRHS